MKLFIAVDISGSMVEEGKQLIVRELLRTIKQYFKYHNYFVDLVFLAVGNQTYVVDWDKSVDYPEEFFKVEKDFSVQSLIEFLMSQESDEAKILIITDGFWTQNSIITFDKFNRLQEKEKIRFVKVNSSSSTKLNKYSTYEAEDIFSALDGFINNSDNPKIEDEEDTDDW